MPIYDYKCTGCGKEYYDLVTKSTDIVLCKECERECIRIFTKMNFKSHFKGSHNAEYNKSGKRGKK